MIELDAAGVLFDNDGVLSNSVDSVDRCWTEWAIAHDLNPADILPFIHGRPARESIMTLAPHLDLDASVAEIEQLEVDAATTTQPMPGAFALLETLPRDRWIVATSGSRRLAAARLRAAGIEPPSMITADDVARGKPHPEPYLAAAGHLGFSPDTCIVFEDTAAGVTAGRAAGATVVGIVGATGADLGADHHIADLSQVTAGPGPAGLRLTIG